MTPGTVSKQIILERLAWIENMVSEIRKLPLSDSSVFFMDNCNVFTAESCLRRALEALLDLGRHILAKGFAEGVTDYKEMAVKLENFNVLSHELAQKFKLMAGYRNRLVHVYHDVNANEKFEICNTELHDFDESTKALKIWLKSHPEIMDETF
jgi:uncharacterized protein YutE (UPF0331/DUF86 family)